MTLLIVCVSDWEYFGWASVNGSLKMVEMLLKAGANVNHNDIVNQLHLYVFSQLCISRLAHVSVCVLLNSICVLFHWCDVTLRWCLLLKIDLACVLEVLFIFVTVHWLEFVYVLVQNGSIEGSLCIDAVMLFSRHVSCRDADCCWSRGTQYQ